MEGDEPCALPTVLLDAAGGLVIRCRGDRELAEGLAWAGMALRADPERPSGLAWRPVALAALEARFTARRRLAWSSGTRLVCYPPAARPTWLDGLGGQPDGDVAAGN
jgi:hypothetical protein